MKKVELLAPAGSFEGFRGAIHAGADAVYIGGRKYGARAYAGNFSKEEVCLAIRYAHLSGRKLYLTVNTLVKESEMEELPEYLRPFYEEGLDGVIVQDWGVFSLLRECFPGLALHGSTQMTVTGARGARFLLSQGASRVVPARELSLEELARIRKVGIEVEAFVHGAMCYGYSGQCLFSSLLGGRSGNRGRCAQPCRLPYRILEEGQADDTRAETGQYPPCPLSLKDLCALQLLPKLLSAGIDSFKIEGRMKKPEYTAGVTALYRKYIDQYYHAPSGSYRVEEADMERLRRLYIRSGIQEGYYRRHNGREMITPQNPGYESVDESFCGQIRESYLEQAPKILVSGKIILQREKPALLELWKQTGDGTELCRIRQTGQMVEPAKKQPLTIETVEKQMHKTGNTPFSFGEFAVCLDEDCFLPVKALNDLRREGLQGLEEAMQEPYRRDGGRAPRRSERPKKDGAVPYLAVSVENTEQLEAVCSVPFVRRLYLNGDVILQGKKEELYSELKAWKIKGGYENGDRGRSLFLAMPHVIRLRDEKYLSLLQKELFCSESLWDGVLIRNLESLGFLQENDYPGEITADAGLYAWNERARGFWEEQGVTATAPLECSKEELHKMGIAGMEVIVYGRSLLMVSANCLRKTGMACPKQCGEKAPDLPDQEAVLWLRDRYRTLFPVRTICMHCYNEIYNSLPLSLHEYGKSVIKEAPAGVRLCFTIEKAAEIRQVLTCFEEFIKAPELLRQADFSFTKGHYKRGAE